MNNDIKKYLRDIGRSGGQKSRRSLSKEEAKSMVRVREAKRAYRQFHAQCFWSFDPEYKITKNDLAWVSDRLMTFGGREGWIKGAQICP